MSVVFSHMTANQAFPPCALDRAPQQSHRESTWAWSLSAQTLQRVGTTVLPGANCNHKATIFPLGVSSRSHPRDKKVTFHHARIAIRQQAGRPANQRANRTGVLSHPSQSWLVVFLKIWRSYLTYFLMTSDLLQIATAPCGLHQRTLLSMSVIQKWEWVKTTSRRWSFTWLHHEGRQDDFIHQDHRQTWNSNGICSFLLDVASTSTSILLCNSILLRIQKLVPSSRREQLQSVMETQSLLPTVRFVCPGLRHGPTNKITRWTGTTKLCDSISTTPQRSREWNNVQMIPFQKNKSSL